MAASSPEKLLEQLAGGKTIAAVLLLGTDHYLREMCRNQIIEACVPETARDWALARLSARDAGWDEILQRAETLPMLAPRQVIVVEEVESVEKLGEKSRDEIIETLGKYLRSPAPFTVLVLEASELDGRQKFRKLLGEKALVVELTIGGESAAALAAQMAKDLGAEIDRDAAALLADIFNSEPARMRGELEKLSTYALGRRITAADVEILSSRRARIPSGSLPKCWPAAGGATLSRSSIIFCAKASSRSELSARLRGRIANSSKRATCLRTLADSRPRGSSACGPRPPKQPSARRTASRRGNCSRVSSRSQKPTAS